MDFSVLTTAQGYLRTIKLGHKKINISNLFSQRKTILVGSTYSVPKGGAVSLLLTSIWYCHSKTASRLCCRKGKVVATKWAFVTTFCSYSSRIVATTASHSLQDRFDRAINTKNSLSYPFSLVKVRISHLV